MAVSKTFNGTTYSIPNTRGESGYETTLSTYLQALADSAGTNVAWKQAVRKATTSPVTVNATTDCTIVVDLSVAGATTVNLPAGADKQIFVIVDGKGDASTNNITIDANGSETIEGSLTKVIRLNRECLVLQYSSSAGDWKVIGGYVPNMVGGPAFATSGRVAVYNGTTGKLLQDGTKLEADLVTGPASSTDNAIARFDSTTGKLIQNSGATVDDSNQVSAASFTATGGTAANNTIYVASNALRLRGGTSGLAFYNTSGTENFSQADVGTASLTTTSGLNLILKKSTGSSLSWWADTTGTSNVFSIDNNSGTMRVLDNASTSTLFSISQAGSITAGPSTFSGVHTLNGVVRCVIPGATTGGFRFSGSSSESHLQCLGANASTNGSLSFYSYRSDLSNEILTGVVSNVGAWTLGHASSTTGRHEIQNNVNSNQTLRVTNAGNSTPNGIYIFYSAAAPNSTSSDFLYCGDTSTGRAIIRSNGGLANYSANNVNLSDVRTKEGIVPAGSYYEKIKSLEVVRFHYKDQNSKTDEDLNLGVVAQQVLEIMPEIVDEGGFNSRDETKLLAIYDTDLMFASIKALQEAMTKIESLQARIEALEAK